MAHPAARVLTVLELLQANGRLSGAELSRRLGVDPRTLRRYIVTLEELGIPITAERGRYGSYSLVPGYKLPPLMFGDDEALALSLGLIAARSLGLAEAQSAAASAQAKLERVMPAPLQRRVRALRETVALDLSPAPAPPDNRALLELSAAAQAQQRVQLDYRAANAEETTRRFDPYGLAWRGGHWYTVGHCHLRGGERSFRLDRVVRVQPLPISFARPARFDALAHLAASIAALPRAIAVEIRLHTDLATARAELGPFLGSYSQEGDFVVLRSRTDSIDWFARQLARLAFDVEIVEPRELSEALLAWALELQLRFAPKPPPARNSKNKVI